MRSSVVVLGGEGLDEGVELRDRGGLGRLGAEPFLQGLLEAFGLAAGGGVSWAGVLLGDVAAGEFGFEGVLASLTAVAGQSDGVDHAVVGECGCGDPVPGKGFAECLDHDWGGDPGVRAHLQGVAGAVVEPADDLDVGAGSAVGTGEPVVGEVGLPGLVRHRGLEPDVGGLRSLLGLGGDQPGPGQVAADGRSRHAVSVVVFEMPGDGLGAGIQSRVGQFLADPHDEVDHVGCECGRGRLGASGAGPERGLALGFVAGFELVDPGAVDAVAGGDLGGALVVDEEGGDDQACFRHGRASNPPPSFL